MVYAVDFTQASPVKFYDSNFQLIPSSWHLQMISSRTAPRQSFSSVNSLVLVGGLNHENHKNKHCWYLIQNAAGNYSIFHACLFCFFHRRVYTMKTSSWFLRVQNIRTWYLFHICTITFFFLTGDSYDSQLLAQLPCPKSSFYSICVANNGIMLTGRL